MANLTEREEFAQRLRKSLECMRVACSPTVVQRHLAVRGTNVTVHGVRKWLEGEAIPTQEKLRAIAAWLGRTPEWLRWGSVQTEQPAPDPLPISHQKLLETFIRLEERDQQLIQAMADVLLKTPNGGRNG